MIADNQLSRALIDLWQPNPEPTSLEETQGYQYEETNSIIDEKAFLHILVAKQGEPSYVPFSKNLGLKDKRRMLFLLIDFGELTIDGLIDPGSLSSAIPEGDLRNLRLLAPQPIVKERPAPTFQFLVANGQVENPESPVVLTFEVRDIEFHEIFIVIEKLTGRIRGHMFLQRVHAVLDMQRGISNFPFFSMRLKTADHKYSNVMEPILCLKMTIPTNDWMVIPILPQLYAKKMKVM